MKPSPALTDTDTMRRRVLLSLTGGTLAVSTGWPLGAAGQTQPAPTEPGLEPPRLALLIGNRDYPDGEDLPPIHKNVNDLRAALERRGFDCTQGLDQDRAGARGLLEKFADQVRLAPADATVLFYFSGHGAQIDAENLLVGARQSPRARADALTRTSLTLINDVLALLPKRPTGLTMAVIDACRTSLKSTASADGLNQVEAPLGTLIAFATGAGRPALSPAAETVNTFYTASLVKVLNSASDEISFSDLFRLVKTDVQNTMLNHPLPLLRQFAQFPFIAENVRVQRRIAPYRPPVANAPVQPRFADLDEAGDFERLAAALWPGEVLRLANAFLERYPRSRLLGSAEVAKDGATQALRLLKRSDVRLYRSAFRSDGLPSEQQSDLRKCGRGDKDAAARMGRYWQERASNNDPIVMNKYEGWMQYAAALGNGIAAYDLALFYRRFGQPHPAAAFESRARELGYTPPPSLDNSRK